LGTPNAFTFNTPFVKTDIPTSIKSGDVDVKVEVKNVNVGAKGNASKVTEIKEGDLGKHIIKGENGRKELAPDFYGLCCNRTFLSSFSFLKDERSVTFFRKLFAPIKVDVELFDGNCIFHFGFLFIMQIVGILLELQFFVHDWFQISYRIIDICMNVIF